MNALPFTCCACLLWASAQAAAEPLQAESPASQVQVTALPALAAPPLRGWTLAREVHECCDGGYGAVNMLYAEHGEENIQLYESTRPVRLLASAGPYWVLWDTKLAHMGALVFVVHVPAEGKPLVVFQSQPMESSSVYLNDELVSCQFSDGTLRLKLLSTDVETGKRYQRHFSISTECTEPH